MFAVASLIAANWAVPGYLIADSVEYMEQAQALAQRRHVLDSQATRGLTYSAFLVPFFVLAETLKSWGFSWSDRWTLWLVQAFQIICCVGVVVATTRLARYFLSEQLRRFAPCAGLLLLLNPVFLQWGTEPLADVPATLFLLLGMEQVLVLQRRIPVGAFQEGADKHGLRAGMHAGALLGLAACLSLKAIVVAGPLLLWTLLVALRGYAASWFGQRRQEMVGQRGSFLRRNLSRTSVGLLLGWGLMFAVQAGSDLLVFGKFGASLSEFFGRNMVQHVALKLHDWGFVSWAELLYNRFSAVDQINHAAQAAARVAPELIERQNNVYWYLQNLDSLLTWPVLVLAGLGAVRLFVRLNWLPLMLLALQQLAHAPKPTKDFRLLFPVLPLFALLAVVGLAWLATVVAARPSRNLNRRGRTRTIVAVGLVLVSGGLGWSQFREFSHSPFSGFVRCAQRIDPFEGQTLAERGSRSRLACVYHWSLFLQTNSDLELVKLPHQLHRWEHLNVSERERLKWALEDLDWFVTHLPLLTDFPDLRTAITGIFEVHDVLYDDTVEELGPLLTFRRKTGSLEELVSNEAPLATAQSNALRQEHVFQSTNPPGQERLFLDGVQLSTYSEGRSAWLSYDWSAEGLRRDYFVISEITCAGVPIWRGRSRLGFETPNSSARSSSNVGEFVFRASQDGAVQPLAGSETDALELWTKVVAYAGAESGPEVARLVPYTLHSDLAVEESVEPLDASQWEALGTDLGVRINRELMVRVAAFGAEGHGLEALTLLD